jgi:hypothetical protein
MVVYWCWKVKFLNYDFSDLSDRFWTLSHGSCGKIFFAIFLSRLLHPRQRSFVLLAPDDVNQDFWLLFPEILVLVLFTMLVTSLSPLVRSLALRLKNCGKTLIGLWFPIYVLFIGLLFKNEFVPWKSLKTLNITFIWLQFIMDGTAHCQQNLEWTLRQDLSCVFVSKSRKNSK